MALTIFDLKKITEDKDKLREFILDNNLFIDFKDSNCFFCSGPIVRSKDSSRKTGFAWRCNNRNCRKFKCSELFGSWFEHSHLEFGKVLLLTYLWASGNVECSFIRDQLGLSRQSVVDWGNFCRDICLDFLEDSSYSQIGGEGVEIEIDESKFGKRKYHKGKRVDGVWVFGGCERRNSQNSFFEVVENRSQEILESLIIKYVRKGSVIYSDSWKGYNTDRLVGLGYTHGTVNHSQHFKDPVSGVHTNTIESTWHHLKHFKHHRHSKELRASYFAEFIFRRKFFRSDISSLEYFSIFLREGINRVYNKDKALKLIRDRGGEGGQEGGSKRKSSEAASCSKMEKSKSS